MLTRRACLRTASRACAGAQRNAYHALRRPVGARWRLVRTPVASMPVTGVRWAGHSVTAGAPGQVMPFILADIGEGIAEVEIMQVTAAPSVGMAGPCVGDGICGVLCPRLLAWPALDHGECCVVGCCHGHV